MMSSVEIVHLIQLVFHQAFKRSLYRKMLRIHKLIKIKACSKSSSLVNIEGNERLAVLSLIPKLGQQCIYPTRIKQVFEPFLESLTIKSTLVHFSSHEAPKRFRQGHA